jgi:ABC-2 type transport system permease protein
VGRPYATRPGPLASIRIGLILMWARARADMQYRLSFVLRVTAAVLVLFGDWVAIWAIADRFGSIGGWTLQPLLYLYGVSALSFRISDAFLGGAVERCAEFVRTGRLDSMLTRPVGVLWQLIGEGFAVRRVMQMLSIVPFFVLGLRDNSIDWSWDTVVVVTLVILNATVLYASIFTIVNTLGFWAPNAAEIANAFTYGGQTAAQYPLHVMDRWVRGVMLSIVPVGFAVYLPAFLVLPNVPNPLNITPTQSWLSLCACVPSALLAGAMWRGALRRYRSTGS